MKNLVHRICQTLERKTRPRDDDAQPLDTGQVRAGETDAVQSLRCVDAYRHHLAGSSPDLHQALGGIEMTLARQLGRQFHRS